MIGDHCQQFLIFFSNLTKFRYAVNHYDTIERINSVVGSSYTRQLANMWIYLKMKVKWKITSFP